jgi:hypothetical protein
VVVCFAVKVVVAAVAKLMFAANNKVVIPNTT